MTDNATIELMMAGLSDNKGRVLPDLGSLFELYKKVAMGDYNFQRGGRLLFYFIQLPSQSRIQYKGYSVSIE